MQIQIRTALIEDRDNITTLLRASYPALMRGSYEDSVLDAVMPTMTAAQPALLRSGTYYVAEATTGAVVGCGGWTKERPGSGEVSPCLAHIRHFGVHPEWTRQGVGRAIYDRCRIDAKDAGINKLECFSSINGESFYAALGFERDRIIDVEMRNGIKFPSVRMFAGI